MKGIIKLRGVSPLIACWLGVACLAVGIGRLQNPPQLAQGEDLLSVVFGDAKNVLSTEFYRMADSYFHGGVDIDCEDGGCEDEDCFEHVEHDHASKEKGSLWDPWQWINRHIRAPEVDRHLAQDKAVEMMPWFWAAVRSDPHNIKAWSAAFYAANNIIKDKEMARRILNEARERNPASAELALDEGRFVYAKGKGDLEEAERLFVEARRLLLATATGGADSLGEEDSLLLSYIESYIRDCNEAVHHTGRFAKP